MWHSLQQIIRQSLRWWLFSRIVRASFHLLFGTQVQHYDRLPHHGPAILVANHNSHLDTAAIMLLFQQNLFHLVRPVAAADHFLKWPFSAWFSTVIMNILPIERQATKSCHDQLADCCVALDRGEILILYPEGTRGEPETMQEFKTGIAHLAKRYPEVPIYPLFLHGFGKSLPKDDHLLVPFCSQIVVGEAIFWNGSKPQFMALLRDRIQQLATEIHIPQWEDQTEPTS
jgi:1-acyl-sn-glycerol-3-phosphate acyltransferase